MTNHNIFLKYEDDVLKWSPTIPEIASNVTVSPPFAVNVYDRDV